MAGRVGSGRSSSTTWFAAAHLPPGQGAGVRPRGRAGRGLGPRWQRRGCGCSAPALLRCHDPRTERLSPWRVSLVRTGPRTLCRTFLQTLLRQEPIALPPAPELSRRYRRLSLRDVFLGYAGYRSPGHPVHRAIARLSPGDPLEVRIGADRWELLDRNGTVVGQLARGYEASAGMRCASATVHRYRQLGP